MRPSDAMKVAIVTGAGSGLGRATAFALAREGYALALTALTREGVAAVAAEITKAGGTTMVRVFDVGRPEECDAFVEDVLEVYEHRIDVLVNNAGYVHTPTDVIGLDEKEWDRCFTTNLRGPFRLIQKVLPVMLERQSGLIVNVASKAARYPVELEAGYNASKAALVALTRTVAREIGDGPLKAISLSPGGMATRMRAKVWGAEDAAYQQDPAFVAQVIADIATGRREVCNGADVLVWNGLVQTFDMEEPLRNWEDMIE